jgi:hypothetical protein
MSEELWHTYHDLPTYFEFHLLLLSRTFQVFAGLFHRAVRRYLGAHSWR